MNKNLSQLTQGSCFNVILAKQMADAAITLGR